MSLIPLSVIVVTKNPGAILDRCLSALNAYDQVIVVDSNSSDRTKSMCAAHYKDYIPFSWSGAYPKKRQWCLEHLELKHDWVFFVDADEFVTPELTEEIRNLFSASLRAPNGGEAIQKKKQTCHDDVAGYFISGQYVWNDTLLSYGLRNQKIALFNRRKMRFPNVDDLDCPGMGEIEGHYQPVLRGKGRVGRLHAPLLHIANYSKQDWLERHKRYAVWEICMTRKNAWPPDPVPWRNTLKKLLRRNPLRPELAFLHSWILKLGFLDGAAGFDFARSRWVYYHLIRSGQKTTSIE